MLNISSNLYNAEWLKLVFKGRNQSYGAYVLRAEAAGTTMRALFIAAPLFVLLFAGPMIYKFIKPEVILKVEADRVVKVIDIPPVPPVEKPKVEEKIEPAPKVENVKTVALPSRPVPVEDAAIVDPPTLKEVENAAIGPVTQAGVETNLATVSEGGNGTGVGTGNGTGDGAVADNSIHEITDIQAYPEFEGGPKAWSKFILKNLRYPYMAQEQGIQGKVFISFVVEKDGSVSNVTITRGIGAGCDEEAARVIKKSPKWKPGKQNNQNVRVRFNMPLSFNLTQ
ncbi:energy transducer TonB [Pedobacter metabolipauper]|nr:energy transducer TonB [Pedobacter metabolipauper]